MAFGWRLRTIVSEDVPQIVPFDQDKFAERLRYGELKPKAALAAYRAMREALIEMARTLTAEQLTRTAQHPERGPITALWILERLVAHDRTHLEQIARREREYADAKKARKEARKAQEQVEAKSKAKTATRASEKAKAAAAAPEAAPSRPRAPEAAPAKPASQPPPPPSTWTEVPPREDAYREPRRERTTPGQSI
jgi:hypothetical protein